MALHYTPLQFQPDTNSLDKQEFDKMMDDLRGRSIDFMDYLIFLKSIKDDDPLYKRIYLKLGKANLDKLRFKSEERAILNLVDNPLLNSVNYSKAIEFYNKHKNKYPNWAKQNQGFFNSLSKGTGFSPNQ